MGRHKFEDQIKEKLASREITPTEGSWNKLRERLDAEEKQPKPIFWWIGIAATLVGGLLIAGMVFFNGKGTTPEIVDTPRYEIVPESNIAEEFIKDGITSEETSPSPNNSEKPSEETKRSNIMPIPEKREIPSIAQSITENLQEKEDATSPGPDKLISQKIEQLIAETTLSGNEDFQPDEIDALLQKAAEEIRFEKQNARISSNVDHQDLLYDVEMELEQSFREKVFDVLKEGYLKAKTAVANRNLP